MDKIVYDDTFQLTQYPRVDRDALEMAIRGEQMRILADEWRRK